MRAPGSSRSNSRRRSAAFSTCADANAPTTRRIALATAVATVAPCPAAEAREHGARGPVTMATIYAVVVRHNVVTALEQAQAGVDTPIPRTKLEIGTQL